MRYSRAGLHPESRPEIRHIWTATRKRVWWLLFLHLLKQHHDRFHGKSGLVFLACSCFFTTTAAAGCTDDPCDSFAYTADCVSDSTAAAFTCSRAATCGL